MARSGFLQGSLFVPAPHKLIFGTTGSSSDVSLTKSAASSLALTGKLDVSNDFSVATSKFTVASSSGNTVCAGTLTMTGAVYAATNVNLDLQTVTDSKPIKINSRNYAQTADGTTSIGFQCRPAANGSGSSSVTGGEISPRANSGIAIKNIIGLHVDSYLKGTAAGNVTGDVRALNLELVTDDAGTRAVTGNVNAIRIRSAFSGTSIGGTFVPIRIEKAETQTNSKQYDAVLDLPSTCSGIWSDTDTASGDTEAGYIKVLVNGNARYIVLYSDAPSA